MHRRKTATQRCHAPLSQRLPVFTSTSPAIVACGCRVLRAERGLRTEGKGCGKSRTLFGWSGGFHRTPYSRWKDKCYCRRGPAEREEPSSLVCLEQQCFGFPCHRRLHLCGIPTAQDRAGRKVWRKEGRHARSRPSGRRSIRSTRMRIPKGMAWGRKWWRGAFSERQPKSSGQGSKQWVSLSPYDMMCISSVQELHGSAVYISRSSSSRGTRRAACLPLVYCVMFRNTPVSSFIVKCCVSVI